MNDATMRTDAARRRVSFDVSEVVLSHLNHIAEVTGMSNGQIASQALLDALPALLERADSLKRRYGEINRAQQQGQQGQKRR